jgi:hypothetical protein
VDIHLNEDDLKRFRRMVGTPDGNGCRRWTGHLTPKGYGCFKLGRYRTLSAHRVSWVVANGRQIPEGLLIRHACDNPACVEPDHLELGTYRDNVHDKIARGRFRNGGMAKTRCIRGHLLAGPNLRCDAKRPHHRLCKSCGYAHSRKSAASRAGTPMTNNQFMAVANARYAALMEKETSR